MSVAGVNGHVRTYYRASRFPRQVNVAFDDAMFLEIRARADRDGCVNGRDDPTTHRVGVGSVNHSHGRAAQQMPDPLRGSWFLGGVLKVYFWVIRW
jgi:hypothetical protein